MSLIHRITMFKLHGLDKQKQLLAAYEKLAKDNSKASHPDYLTPGNNLTPIRSDKVKQDGKPYIAYLCAGLSNPEDPRNKGYTVISQTKFKSIDDMKFYDESCTAHQELKALVKGLGPEEPPLTVYFDCAPLVDQTHA